MKKSFALVAVLLAGLIMVVGCSQDKEPAETLPPHLDPRLA